MRIIFLDIDGVMNSERYYRTVDRNIKGWSRFDPSAVILIKRLIEEFDAKIVISSTWRFGAVEMLKDELVKLGLIKYLHKDWKTPQIYSSNRGSEINMWLEKYKDIENYVIIDDDNNILKEQEQRMVKTELMNGMEEEHYNKVREIFLSK